MNSVNISIKVLSPVHVGTGQKLNPNFEYLYFPEEKKIALLDESKILDIIGVDNLDQWVSVIDKEENLLDYLRLRKVNIKATDCAQFIMEVEGEGPMGNNEVKPQFRGTTTKSPMIPGSSIKGALKTVMLNYLIEQNPQFIQNPDHLGVNKRGFKFNDKQILAHYFGAKDRPDFRGNIQLDANKDWFRLLRVGDVAFSNLTTSLHKVKVINSEYEGWGEKKKETGFWECIPTGSQSEFRLQIPADLLVHFKRKVNLKLPEKLLNIKAIFKCANEHLQKILTHEIKFWQEEDNPEVIEDYLNQLINLDTQINELTDKECLLRVGAGGGWIDKTGAWPKKEGYLRDDVWNHLKSELRRGNYNDSMFFPKSRKMVDGGLPLGFVKLSVK